MSRHIWTGCIRHGNRSSPYHHTMDGGDDEAANNTSVRGHTVGRTAGETEGGKRKMKKGGTQPQTHEPNEVDEIHEHMQGCLWQNTLRSRTRSRVSKRSTNVCYMVTNEAWGSTASGAGEVHC